MTDNNKIREEVKALTERLETGIQDLYASDKYAAYLATLARFHNYSTRNTMLIYLQMPEATQVAGFNKWKNEFERHVTKGQKGIRIFAPSPYIIKKEMEKLDPETQAPLLDKDGKPIVEEVYVTIPAFKPVSVFDVSQTDGKPLPSLAENLTGDVHQYDAFLGALRDVSVMPIGFEPLAPETDGECRYDSRAIAIREGMSEVQTVSTILHEMTHAEIHDYNRQLEQQEQAAIAETAGQDAPETAPKPRTRRAEEVEAESVSYVVCRHYGIETGDNSFGYVASWSKGRELDELKASLDIIRKTAASMIERIDGRFAEICKERGIDLTPVQDAPVIQDAVSNRDELDAQVVINRDERGQAAPDAPKAEQPEQVSPAAPPEATALVTEEKTSRKYSELQQKGIEIAQRYEKLPMQDRLNIIAETFGCKTASIETSPCTGKWRGTSDISIILDNGASLGIGNYRTPQAKTAKVQNECVNNALARYNPEIVSEIKARATAVLSKREAEDNAVAVQKGLKPYTFLNVELNDGSGKLSGSYLGWYYVTLAVDGKIHTLVETGLNYEIAAGAVSEHISSRNYYPAGALKDADVDFIFNNVGHSSVSGLYSFHLIDEVRERAEKTLAERSVPDIGEQELAPDILPDPGIGLSERDLYGHTDPAILPMLQARALELFDQDHTVYLLYQGGAEAMAFDRADIETHDGIFGIEAEEWQTSQDFGLVKAALRESEASKEAGVVHGKDATYDIYQLKDVDKTRDYRWESLANLEARGLSVSRDNYHLVYSAPLTDADTPHSLYAQFNVDRPADFTGHSLSMSDVIVIQQDGNSTAHYIDRADIAELPDFFREEPQPEIAAPEAERRENDHINDISVPTPPSVSYGSAVAELQAQAQAGQQISLLDLAKAVKNEQPAPREKPAQPVRRKAEKPSILAQLQEAKKAAAQERGQQKNAPKRDSEREV